jgi:hypothetical protein
MKSEYKINLVTSQTKIDEMELRRTEVKASPDNYKEINRVVNKLNKEPNIVATREQDNQIAVVPKDADFNTVESFISANNNLTSAREAKIDSGTKSGRDLISMLVNRSLEKHFNDLEGVNIDHTPGSRFPNTFTHKTAIEGDKSELETDEVEVYQGFKFNSDVIDERLVIQLDLKHMMRLKETIADFIESYPKDDPKSLAEVLEGKKVVDSCPVDKCNITDPRDGCKHGIGLLNHSQGTIVKVDKEKTTTDEHKYGSSVLEYHEEEFGEDDYLTQKIDETYPILWVRFDGGKSDKAYPYPAVRLREKATFDKIERKESNSYVNKIRRLVSPEPKERLRKTEAKVRKYFRTDLTLSGHKIKFNTELSRCENNEI